MRAPRTDFGTVVLHGLIVGSVVAALATGLRIAADEPGTRWLMALDVLLPREHIWYWHLVAGLGCAAAFAAYIAYMRSARLGRRVRLDRNRLAALFRGGRQAWAAAGILILWIGFAAFAVAIASGVLLYLDPTEPTLAVHRAALWICLAFPFLHLAAHAAHGGLRQVLRVFRPTALAAPPPEPDILALLAEHMQIVDDLRQGRDCGPSTATATVGVPQKASRPLLAALGWGLATAALAATIDTGTASKLVIPALRQFGEGKIPVIDGDLSDPIWASAPAVTVFTDHGANFGGGGRSKIEVRAVHDGERVYFAFTWEDPTRSLKHQPLIKGVDGWRVGRTRAVTAQEESFWEDQFSVLFSRPTTPIVGAAIHLAPQPLPQRPASASGRGLHYTGPNGLADVWVWRADHGGLAGYLEDAHFAAPQDPTPAQAAAAEPYPGGFAPDEGDDCYSDNVSAPIADRRTPLRLPKDLAAVTAAMGQVRDSAEASEDEGSRWWLTLAETEEYSAAADARIPVGTVLPNVIAWCAPAGDRGQVRGMARWSAGRWTLEVVRRLDTGSADDVAIVSGVMMWLAAFDHSATAHTRHLRPLTLELL